MEKIFSFKNINNRSKKRKKDHGKDPEGFIVEFILDHIYKNDQPENKKNHIAYPDHYFGYIFTETQHLGKKRSSP